MPNKKRNSSFKKNLLAFAFGLIVLILSIIELYFSGETTLFWIGFVLSILIVLPNVLWLSIGAGDSYGLKYILTMLKTKKGINTIKSLSKRGKFFERMSACGLCLGFGLAGVDYLVAREKKGLKRILVLLVGAILLGILFYFTMQILFALPALASLLLFGLIGFVLFGFAGLSLVFLLGYGFISVFAAFVGRQICPSIAPVLPGVPIPGLGTIIPLIAWVSLGLILVIHEFSHGVMFAYYKQKIISVGLILVGLIPMGAFVEQDDKEFVKLNEKKQVMILSAGPSSNLLTVPVAVIILLAFSFAVAPISTIIADEYANVYGGVQVAKTETQVSYCGITKDAPAQGKLLPNDKIISLNGVLTSNVSELNGAFYLDKNLGAPMAFVVLRDGKEENIIIEPVVFDELGRQVIGASFEGIPTGYAPALQVFVANILIEAISSILFFLALLSFAVGMFNFLPADPLDGGRIAKVVLLPYFSFLGFNKKDTQKFIGRLFVWIFLISILLNLLPYLTMIT